MGCSSSILITKPNVLAKQNQIHSKSKSLLDICQSGDLAHAIELVQRSKFSEINKADWSTGDTPLHLATSHGFIDIVRVLLEHGAVRNISNYQNKLPATYATTNEMKQLFQRSLDDSFARFISTNAADEFIYCQKSLDATQFYMEFESEMSFSGQWDIIQTVDVLRKVSQLQKISQSDIIWYFFDQAREKTDVKYLIRAHTVESKFSKILNRKLIQRHLTKTNHDTDENRQIQILMQNTMSIFNQRLSKSQTQARSSIDNSQITDWIHRYLGTIHSLIYQVHFPFEGQTYRGMWMKKDKLISYSKSQFYLCNKTLISTSTNYQFIKDLLDKSPPLTGYLPVICTYVIDSSTSFKAIDIHKISEYPDENEVLIFPGVPFEIRKIHFNSTTNLIEIELISTLSDFGNFQKMFSIE